MTLEDGAGLYAPTAPHATAPAPDATRPKVARLFAPRLRFVAPVLAALLSVVAHGRLFPHMFDLPPPSEFKDFEGELSIPVDLLEDTAIVQPAEPPPTPAQPVAVDDPHAPGKGLSDGGAVTDASSLDAAAKVHDAGAKPDAASDGGEDPDAGAIALADAAAVLPGSGAPRDPGAMVGIGNVATAGTINVTLLVNMVVIRTHPLGAKLGPMLRAIPQWDEFMNGTETLIDPVRDTDWLMIYGPSLAQTDRDAILIHYSAPDALVDKAIDVVASHYDQGGAYDAGVPGVRAALAHADRSERVFLRPQHGLLVVVPPDKANEFARSMKAKPVNAKVRPGEAVRLVVKDPSRARIFPGLPKDLSEVRLWAIPRPDGGVDVYVEGDFPSPEAAAAGAVTLTGVIAKQNTFIISAATGGLLSGATFDANENKAQMHLVATASQLDTIMQLIQSFLPAPKK